jgi:nitrogen regulatory protein P-II 1
MKKIEAIIRPEKLRVVREALEELGYPGITISDIKGHGKQKGLTQQWRGQEYKVELLSKVKIEIVVLDEDVGKTLNAIVREARTGEMGDGKIFVLPVETAVRVRTGDEGMNAI